MQQISLNVNIRTSKGKGASHSCRRRNKIPGILYGLNKEPVPLEIDLKVFNKTLKSMTSENTIINLTTSDGMSQETMIKEIQRDPVHGKVIHVDFKRIKLEDEIEVEVPIELTGISIGAKEKGGIVNQVLREIQIKSLPLNIPEKIVVDISNLDLNDSIHVSDLALENVKILTPGSITIVTVSAPQVEEVKEEKPEGEEVKEPEVVKKGKEKAEGEEEEKEKEEKGKK